MNEHTSAIIENDIESQIPGAKLLVFSCYQPANSDRMTPRTLHSDRRSPNPTPTCVFFKTASKTGIMITYLTV